MAATAGRKIIPHLAELRGRLLRLGLWFSAAFLVSLFISPRIFRLLFDSLGVTVSEIGISSILSFYAGSSLLIAGLLLLPLFVKETYEFVKPGLKASELDLVSRLLPVSFLLFLMGVFVGFLMIKPSIAVAQTIAKGYGITAIFTANDIFGFSLLLMLLCGVAFQYPLLMKILLKLNVTTKTQLRRNRRLAYFIIIGVAAFISPGSNIMTNVILFGVLISLYETSIFFS